MNLEGVKNLSMYDKILQSIKVNGHRMTTCMSNKGKKLITLLVTYEHSYRNSISGPLP